MTINVNDVAENSSPTDIILSSIINISENSPANTVVGTFRTTDPDSSDTFIYQLISGYGADDNAAFTIVENQLRINSSPDFETQSSYSIRVQTTDSTGNSYSEVLIINVNDVGESPTDLVLSSSSVNENSLSGAVVGTFGTTDPDNRDTFTYQLISGYGDDDNAAFTIVGDQLRINSSLDFETQSIYRILVQTTDSTGASYLEALIINVNNVAESPTDIVLSNSSINSNSRKGAIVGTFSTSDPDNGKTFTYRLISGYALRARYAIGDDDNAAFTIVTQVATYKNWIQKAMIKRIIFNSNPLDVTA